jgi:hypothetical protein
MQDSHKIQYHVRTKYRRITYRIMGGTIIENNRAKYSSTRVLVSYPDHVQTRSCSYVLRVLSSIGVLDIDVEYSTLLYSYALQYLLE